ncbi:Hypothetical predicted protein [Octopus vulgaris]|uniref:Uncharacterized protein n=1 Tax=Octopus vulgaris TaxID=6645 RepID=A0AA36FFM9_OCTVU|nr:Hypothetical predicted protein [Octopus vulgaris]
MDITAFGGKYVYHSSVINSLNNSSISYNSPFVLTTVRPFTVTTATHLSFNPLTVIFHHFTYCDWVEKVVWGLSFTNITRDVSFLQQILIVCLSIVQWKEF